MSAARDRRLTPLLVELGRALGRQDRADLGRRRVRPGPRVRPPAGSRMRPRSCRHSTTEGPAAGRVPPWCRQRDPRGPGRGDVMTGPQRRHGAASTVAAAPRSPTTNSWRSLLAGGGRGPGRGVGPEPRVDERLRTGKGRRIGLDHPRAPEDVRGGGPARDPPASSCGECLDLRDRRRDGAGATQREAGAESAHRVRRNARDRERGRRRGRPGAHRHRRAGGVAAQ